MMTLETMKFGLIRDNKFHEPSMTVCDDGLMTSLSLSPLLILWLSKSCNGIISISLAMSSVNIFSTSSNRCGFRLWNLLKSKLTSTSWKYTSEVQLLCRHRGHMNKHTYGTTLYLHFFQLREISGRDLMFALDVLVNGSEIFYQFLFLTVLPKHRRHLFVQRADYVSVNLRNKTMGSFCHRCLENGTRFAS